MGKNLFKEAAKTSTAKAGKKEAEVIDISIIAENNQLKYPGAAELILDYQKFHEQAAQAKAELEAKGAQLKKIGIEIWTAKYEEQKSRPDSFFMSGTLKVQKEDKTFEEKSGRLMFISSDSYKKIDELTASVLESTYNCITRKELYYFDPELLQKYQDAISKAIMNSKAIAPEDKPNIIKKNEDVVIKKGTIDNVELIASITGKVEQDEEPFIDKDGKEVPVYQKFDDVASLIVAVEPTFSLKN